MDKVKQDESTIQFLLRQLKEFTAYLIFKLGNLIVDISFRIHDPIPPDYEFPTFDQYKQWLEWLERNDK